MFSKRMALLLFSATVLLVLLAAQCGTAPTPETAKVIETVVLEKEAEAEAVVAEETPEEGEVVTFMSWAEDDFEVEAIERLVELFKAEHPDVRVECEIVSFVPAEGTTDCTIVPAEGGGQ
jgi:ABC-type glycerol-3-phosphate transport system substrate-binding protein